MLRLRYITHCSQILWIFLSNIYSCHHTFSDFQTWGTVDVKFYIVFSSVCRPAYFGILTLFHLSGRTNSAFNYTYFKWTLMFKSIDASQYFYTDCLTNHLACLLFSSYCHIGIFCNLIYNKSLSSSPAAFSEWSTWKKKLASGTFSQLWSSLFCFLSFLSHPSPYFTRFFCGGLDLTSFYWRFL